MRFKNCHHQWQVVPKEKYTLKDKTSLATLNPMLILIECKHCKTRKWVYKNLNK